MRAPEVRKPFNGMLLDINETTGYQWMWLTPAEAILLHFYIIFISVLISSSPSFSGAMLVK
jgi:hypothetical protein